MSRRRVKITGIGPVTPAGIGCTAFEQGIFEPVSYIRPYANLGDEFGPFVAAHISSFDIKRYLNDISALPKSSARHTLFAVAGAILALQDAQIQKKELVGVSCAVVTGTTLMDFGGTTSTIDAVQKRGIRGALARTVYTTNIAAVPGAINQILGITARTMALQSSCCSGMDAIGYAAELVANGEVDIALCGGTEAPLHRCALVELRAAGLTPPTSESPERLCRPFDLWRTTGVVSEGACIFVIEPESSPRQGYSYISGYGFANDDVDNLCGGIVSASKLAMADARIRPSQIEAISAWGPGHRLIDAGEYSAMNEVFGSALSEIPVNSIKAAIGSPLGAAPAIQVAATALAQRNSILPPTVNWQYPDPACPFNLSNQARPVSHGVTLINTHGLAGVNSCMILERC